MSIFMPKNEFIIDMYKATKGDMSVFKKYPYGTNIKYYTNDTNNLVHVLVDVHSAMRIVEHEDPEKFQQHLIDNTMSVAINSIYANLYEAFYGMKKAVDTDVGVLSACNSMEAALTKRATAIENAQKAIDEGEEFLKPHYCSRGGFEHCNFDKTCIRRARADGKICREDKAFDDATCPRREFCNGEFTEKQEEVLKKHNMSLCPCSYSHICIVRIRADDRVECFEDEVLDAHKITRRKNCMEPCTEEQKRLVGAARVASHRKFRGLDD